MRTSKERITDSGKFPVVAIGASAGGLEALEQFFTNMPENSGMAFVVIQHLDPHYKGMMPELIQKTTSMKVLQVTDLLKVNPNTVYVLPPNKTMSVLNGRLHLFDLVESHLPRLPINFFLQSLADDMGERSIGVILSGMGSDGSLGLQSIKDHSGLTVVQEPLSAKFDSMPRSAIKSVQVDIIAPAQEIPSRLISILGKTFPLKKDMFSEIKDQSSIEKIILLVRSKTGHDFSQYKKNTIYRRVERRMMIHKIDRIDLYVRFLQVNPKEIDILFNELLIGTTSFFRDAAVWDYLRKDLLSSLLEKKPEGYRFRIWIPGCSTGEEAYSFAMILKDIVDSAKSKKNISFQIFASDLDSEAIEKARSGFFNPVIAASVSKERLEKYFNKTGSFYRINSEIREMIIFAVQNVIADPPFTRIDLISCRNLMIYLEHDMQRKLLSTFHYCLNPQGILILGPSETIGQQSFLLDPVNSHFRVFRKRSVGKIELIDFPYTKPAIHNNNVIKTIVKTSDNIQSLTENLILHQYSPAGVLVNKDGDIIFITRRSGKYLEPATGKANINIFSMLREGLNPEFPVAFRMATRNFEKVVLKKIRIVSENEANLVDVIIQQIDKPSALNGLILIVFRDVPAGHRRSIAKNKSATNLQLSELEAEQQRLKDELQSSLEAMQVSEEELKSANEELQSTNEELQSTNEELTTSKEELQSMNEELQTVNQELVNKVDELTEITNDMKNLLESTEIASLFLTKDLIVRRFTTGIRKIFSLKEQDLGRPLSDFTSELHYEDFYRDMAEVLRTLVFIEKNIESYSGMWFQVRIMPYRTLDDKIDGLVLTFMDITSSKKLEAELYKKLSDLKDTHNI